MASVVIAGNTSGSVTLDAPAVAGTTVLTLPATSGTVVTTATSTGISGSAITTGTVGVSVGGTGANTLTANNVILGNGTSAVQFVAPGTNGNLLTSNGTTWTSAAAPAAGVTSVNGQTGAVVTTNLDSIGSSGIYIYTAAGTATLNTGVYVSANTTVAGSTLRYDISDGANNTGAVQGACYTTGATQTTSYGGGGSSLSGTWRIMQRSMYSYNAHLGGGTYRCYWSGILLIRIS
jgi:hypothetical protein